MAAFLVILNEMLLFCHLNFPALRPFVFPKSVGRHLAALLCLGRRHTTKARTADDKIEKDKFRKEGGGRGIGGKIVQLLDL